MEWLILASYILRTKGGNRPAPAAEEAFYRRYQPGGRSLLPPVSALAAVALYAAALGWLPG